MLSSLARLLVAFDVLLLLSNCHGSQTFATNISGTKLIVDSTHFKWIIHWTSDVDVRARCLDGTPAAFYTSFAPSGSRNSDKWILSMMWGGWCSLDVPIDWRDEHTVDHCYHRSNMYKGTSKGRQSANNVGEMYYQIRDAELNPTFHDWNFAYVPYCDGTSLSGRRDDSVILDGPYGIREIFFRGGYIRDAIAKMLLPLGLCDANVVVITGTSAGGLAALMHADWWAEEIVPQAKVLGLIDCGFFPNYTADNSSNVEIAPFVFASNVTEYPIQSFVDQMRYLCERSHADVHRTCSQAIDPWRCMLGKELVSFIKVPMFFLSSLYDSWQLPNELGYTSNLTKVNAHGRLVYNDHLELLSRDGGALGHGAFLHSCSSHLGQWFLDINGTDMRHAVAQWFQWHLAAFRLQKLGKQRPPLPVSGAEFGAGYMLWLQDRPYPCGNCCQGQETKTQHRQVRA